MSDSSKVLEMAIRLIRLSEPQPMPPGEKPETRVRMHLSTLAKLFNATEAIVRYGGVGGMLTMVGLGRIGAHEDSAATFEAVLGPDKQPQMQRQLEAIAASVLAAPLTSSGNSTAVEILADVVRTDSGHRNGDPKFTINAAELAALETVYRVLPYPLDLLAGIAQQSSIHYRRMGRMTVAESQFEPAVVAMLLEGDPRKLAERGLDSSIDASSKLSVATTHISPESTVGLPPAAASAALGAPLHADNPLSSATSFVWKTPAMHAEGNMKLKTTGNQAESVVVAPTVMRDSSLGVEWALVGRSAARELTASSIEESETAAALRCFGFLEAQAGWLSVAAIHGTRMEEREDDLKQASGPITPTTVAAFASLSSFSSPLDALTTAAAASSGMGHSTHSLPVVVPALLGMIPHRMAEAIVGNGSATSQPISSGRFIQWCVSHPGRSERVPVHLRAAHAVLLSRFEPRKLLKRNYVTNIDTTATQIPDAGGRRLPGGGDELDPARRRIIASEPALTVDEVTCLHHLWLLAIGRLRRLTLRGTRSSTAEPTAMYVRRVASRVVGLAMEPALQLNGMVTSHQQQQLGDQQSLGALAASLQHSQLVTAAPIAVVEELDRAGRAQYDQTAPSSNRHRLARPWSTAIESKGLLSPTLLVLHPSAAAASFTLSAAARTATIAWEAAQRSGYFPPAALRALTAGFTRTAEAMVANAVAVSGARAAAAAEASKTFNQSRRSQREVEAENAYSTRVASRVADVSLPVRWNALEAPTQVLTSPAAITQHREAEAASRAAHVPPSVAALVRRALTAAKFTTNSLIPRVESITRRAPRSVHEAISENPMASGSMAADDMESMRESSPREEEQQQDPTIGAKERVERLEAEVSRLLRELRLSADEFMHKGVAAPCALSGLLGEGLKSTAAESTARQFGSSSTISNEPPLVREAQRLASSNSGVDAAAIEQRAVFFAERSALLKRKADAEAALPECEAATEEVRQLRRSMLLEIEALKEEHKQAMKAEHGGLQTDLDAHSRVLSQRLTAFREKEAKRVEVLRESLSRCDVETAQLHKAWDAKEDGLQHEVARLSKVVARVEKDAKLSEMAVVGRWPGSPGGRTTAAHVDATEGVDDSAAGNKLPGRSRLRPLCIVEFHPPVAPEADSGSGAWTPAGFRSHAIGDLSALLEGDAEALAGEPWLPLRIGAVPRTFTLPVGGNATVAVGAHAVS